MTDTPRTLVALQTLLADTGATAINPQNVRDALVSVYPSTFNVKNYGALGDGTTDDTVAIQAAITACAADGGGIVFFPNGTYMATFLTLKTKVRLVGTSRYRCGIYQISGTASPIIQASPAVGGALQHVTIEDMIVSAYYNQTANTGGILLSGVSHSSLHRVHVSYTRDYGFKVQEYTASSGDAMFNTISECLAGNLIDASTPSAFWLSTGVAANNLRDCHVNAAGHAGVGYKISDAGGGTPTGDNVIDGCRSLTVTTPVNIDGNYNKVINGRFEVVDSATMTVVSNGARNVFERNSYAVNNGATPGALTFTDTAGDTLRRGEVETGDFAGGKGWNGNYSGLTDPGNTGAVIVTAGIGWVPLVTGGAETRTLAAPTYVGQELCLYAKTLVGNCVVTCATTINETGNNTITFSATGQAVRLFAVEEGSNLRWRCAVADGAALTTV